MARKKFVIAITSFAFVFVAALVSIVAIFAAQRQQVTTGFRVRFTATDVSAAVRGNVIVGDTITPMTTTSGEDEVWFEAADSQTNSALYPNYGDDDAIILEGENTTVAFEYIFTNESSTVDFKVAYSDDFSENPYPSASNIKVKYTYSHTRLVDLDSVSDIFETPTTSVVDPLMVLGNGDQAGQCDTLYFYVFISVKNMANNAHLDGEMNFALASSEYVELGYDELGRLDNYEMINCRRYIPTNTDITSLPAPIVDGDENIVHAWYNVNSGAWISYPINTSYNMPPMVCWDNAPYVAEIEYDGYLFNISITNLSEDNIYVDIGQYSSFSYGGKYYPMTKYSPEYVKGDEYLIVDPSQTVKYRGYADGGDLDPEHYGSSYLITKDGIATRWIDSRVYLEEPSDLQETWFYSGDGEYPQTYVGNEMNERLKSATLTKTGKTYTTDIMGETFVLDEVVYRGNKYVGVNALTYTEVTTSTGDKINGVYDNRPLCYFKVEPIVSRAVEYCGEGEYIMMAVDVLGSSLFRESSSPASSSWEGSNLMSFLDNLFLNESGLNDVAMYHGYDTTNYFDENSTMDSFSYIFIPSVEEALSWIGHEDSLDTFISAGGYLDIMGLQKVGTDFAKCTYLSTLTSGDPASSCYWLRTPYSAEGGVCYVTPNGHIDGTGVGELAVGYAPCFRMSVV